MKKKLPIAVLSTTFLFGSIAPTFAEQGTVPTPEIENVEQIIVDENAVENVEANIKTNNTEEINDDVVEKELTETPTEEVIETEKENKPQQEVVTPEVEQKQTEVTSVKNKETKPATVTQTEISVSTESELKDALKNEAITKIILTKDIAVTDSIAINRSNVTIDGGNFTLSLPSFASYSMKKANSLSEDGPAEEYNAITINGDRVTLKNLHVTGGGWAALSIQGNDVTVQGGSFANSSSIGIEIGSYENAIGTKIQDVAFTNVAMPIYTFNSVNVTNTTYTGVDSESTPIIFEGSNETPIIVTIDGTFTHDSTVGAALGLYGTVQAGASSTVSFESTQTDADGYSIWKASTSSVKVETEEEFKAALENTAVKTITLTENVTVSDSITINRNDVTVNGNGFTISLPSLSTFSAKNARTLLAEEEPGEEYNAITINGDNVTIKNATITGGDWAAVSVQGNAFTLENSVVASDALIGVEIGSYKDVVGTNITNVQFKDVIMPIDAYNSVTLTNTSYSSTDAFFAPIMFEGTKTNPVVITIEGSFELKGFSPVAEGYNGSVVAGTTSVESFEKVEEYEEDGDLYSVWDIVKTDGDENKPTETVNVSSEKEFKEAINDSTVGKVVLENDITITDLLIIKRDNIEIDVQGFTIRGAVSDTFAQKTKLNSLLPNDDISVIESLEDEEELGMDAIIMIDGKNVTITNVNYESVTVFVLQDGFKLQDASFNNSGVGIMIAPENSQSKNIFLERVTFNEVMSPIYTANNITLIDTAISNSENMSAPIYFEGESMKNPVVITIDGDFDYEGETGIAEGYNGKIVTGPNSVYEFEKIEEYEEDGDMYSLWDFVYEDEKPGVDGEDPTIPPTTDDDNTDNGNTGGTDNDQTPDDNITVTPGTDGETSPQTGDNGVLPWSASLLAALAGFFAFNRKTRKY